MPPELAHGPISVLVRFARLVSEELEADRVLEVLARAAVEEVGADAAGAFAVTVDGRARLAAGFNLPDGAAGLSSDAVGPELGETLRAACGGRFAAAHVLPLVSGGDLFGALVLAFVRGAGLTPASVELAQGLVDVAAVAQRTAAQVRALRSSLADLRAARELLARGEKLRALGQMAAGIVHDLANAVGPLSMDVGLLRDAAGAAPERAARAAARMERNMRVALDTLERLRRFARQAPEPGHGPVDPAAAVRDAVELCAARARGVRPGPLELRADVGAVPSVVVSRSDFVSALVNLIGNAIDVQPQGGAVDVRAGTDERGGAWVEVSDRGPGIAPEHQERIFEPFFTTKGEAGTGLGLANVYAFARRHSGEVTFRTSGEGTTFRLRFPRAPEAT